EYPKENRSKVKEVYLNEPDLEGELDLREFTYYEVGAKVLISLAVNETKLNLKNLPKNTKIIRLIPVQEYLNKEYPTRQEREQVKALDVSDKNLEGSLDLSDFVSLKELNCQCNKLTSLNLTNCLQLEKVECSYNKLINLDISNCFPLTKLNCDDNLLTNLILPANLINLKELRLNDNNFPLQDLSFLREVTNLEILCLGNNMIINNGEKANRGIYNRFIGSLDYLSEMKRLEVLDIRNTDINEVDIAQLPKSLETIVYSIDKRPNCQLKTIISQLDKLFANASPYLDKNYDAFLALDVVCNGLRPNLEKLKIPQLLKDLIESKYVQTLFYQQYLEIKDEYDNFSQNLAYKSHPTAIMTSKLINTRQISELLREHAASKDLELSLFRSNEMTDQGL
ncbi:23718_t:CDS:2, partial [Racocetra persica]